MEVWERVVVQSIEMAIITTKTPIAVLLLYKGGFPMAAGSIFLRSLMCLNSALAMWKWSGVRGLQWEKTRGPVKMMWCVTVWDGVVAT